MARVGNLDSISEVDGRLWVEDPDGVRQRIYAVKQIRGREEELVQAIPYDLQSNNDYTVNEILEDIPDRITTYSHAEKNPDMEYRDGNAARKENQKDELSFEAFLARYARSRILGRG